MPAHPHVPSRWNPIPLGAIADRASSAREQDDPSRGRQVRHAVRRGHPRLRRPDSGTDPRREAIWTRIRARWQICLPSVHGCSAPKCREPNKSETEQR